MTTTATYTPDPAERAALHDGRLLPALLQAVRDEKLAEQDAPFAFYLAVPVAAARLGLTTSGILRTTMRGELHYGPNGLTIAEECEAEAVEQAIERD